MRVRWVTGRSGVGFGSPPVRHRTCSGGWDGLALDNLIPEFALERLASGWKIQSSAWRAGGRLELH